MKCPRCQAENPPGTRFYGQCAAPPLYTLACNLPGLSSMSGDTLDKSTGSTALPGGPVAHVA